MQTRQKLTSKTHKTPSALCILTVLTAAAMIVLAARVFWFTPREAVMGDVQKVFYFHLSSAWVGALAFLSAAISGIGYLRSRRMRWDDIGSGSVEVGTLFSFITVLSGMSWARPIWNTWWTWDPRLTTTAIMLLAYVVYLLLRRSVEDPESRARFSAVYAILAFLSVPVTFLSIRMLRTIHPVLFGAGSTSSGMGLSQPMLLTLLMSLAVFSLLFAVLLWHQVRLQRMTRLLEEHRSLED